MKDGAQNSLSATLVRQKAGTIVGRACTDAQYMDIRVRKILSLLNSS